MPLTKKGEKILSGMKSEYGDKKGEQVFYASRNAGKISGVDPESSGRKTLGTGFRELISKGMKGNR